MAEEKKQEKKEEKAKPELSREYIIPLRKEILKVPQYRRAKKAVKAVKEFLAKHMKVEDRDIRNVKINIYLNNEIWHRGIKNPLTKVKVKAEKINGIVYAELAEIPDYVKWNMQKNERRNKVDEKAVKQIAKKEQEEKKDETTTPEEKKDESEKEKATVEAGVKEQKLEAKQAKHQSPKQPKQQQIHRMALQK